MLKGSFLALTVVAGLIACLGCLRTGATLLDSGLGLCNEGGILESADTRDAEQEIFTQLNDVRRRRGLKEFVRREILDNDARKQSAAMACRGSLFHQDPEAALRNLRRQGEEGTSLVWAENVGVVPVGNVKRIGPVREPGDAGKALVTLWMESPGHRANITKNRFESVGVGVVRDGSGAYYGTVNFLGP